MLKQFPFQLQSIGAKDPPSQSGVGVLFERTACSVLASDVMGLSYCGDCTVEEMSTRATRRRSATVRQSTT